MARLGFVFIIFFLFGNLCAQESPQKVKLTEKKYSRNFIKSEKYSYDSTNFLVENKVKLSGGSDDYVESFFYEINRLKKVEVIGKWKNEWKDAYYLEYDYDDKGNRIYSLKLTFRKSDRKIEDKSEYEYIYENNKLVGWTGKFKFDPELKAFIEYDSEGRKIKEVVKRIIDSDSLINSREVFYEYDDIGRISKKSEYAWEKEEWVEVHIDEFSYDEHGNCIELYKIYREKYHSFNVYEYDLDYTIDEVVMPYALEDDIQPFRWTGYVHKLDKEQEFSINNITGESQLVNQVDYIYDSINADSGEKTDSADVSLDDVVIYPNPANEKVNISFKDGELKNITIFDISGNTVLTHNVGNQKEIELDISLLSPGVYVFQITTAEGRISRKVVVE